MSRLNSFSFERKTFKNKMAFKNLKANYLKNIKNIDKVSNMKELISGALLLGIINEYIINLKINEIHKKNKIWYKSSIIKSNEIRKF